jgi:hypothetical protein
MNLQKDYKENSSLVEMKERGQTTIFVIIAIVIVIGGILVYFLVPGVRNAIGGDISPSSFVRDCVEDEVRSGVELLSKQGGYANPEGFVLHDGNKVKYLCYTSQYYLPCKVQQPLIKRNFERELEGMIEAKTDECVQELKADYERRGFSVSGVQNSRANVEIVPDNVRILIEAPLTVSKDEQTQSFRSFDVVLASEMYDLLMISTSIVDFESTYGDTETTLYYQYYPNLVIEKDKLTDGTTVYGVEDVTTKEKFVFASRSLAWPGGYGYDD